MTFQAHDTFDVSFRITEGETLLEKARRRRLDLLRKLLVGDLPKKAQPVFRHFREPRFAPVSELCARLAGEGTVLAA